MFPKQAFQIYSFIQILPAKSAILFIIIKGGVSFKAFVERFDGERSPFWIVCHLKFSISFIFFFIVNDKFSLLKTLFEFSNVIYRLEHIFWVPGCPIKGSTVFTCSVYKKLGKITARLLKSLDLGVDQKVSTMNHI